MANDVRHLNSYDVDLQANVVESGLFVPLGTREVHISPSNTSYAAFGTDPTATVRLTLPRNKTTVLPCGGHADLRLLSTSNGSAFLTFYGGRQTTGARALGPTQYFAIAANSNEVHTVDVPSQATHAIIDNNQPIRYTVDGSTNPTETVGLFAGARGDEFTLVEIAPYNELRLASATDDATTFVVQLLGDIGRGDTVLRPVGEMFNLTVVNSGVAHLVVAPGRSKFARVLSSVNLKWCYGDRTPLGAGNGAFLSADKPLDIPVNSGTQLTFQPGGATSYTIVVQYYSYGFGS